MMHHIRTSYHIRNITHPTISHYTIYKEEHYVLILRLIPYTNTQRKWVWYMTSQRTVSRESCNTS